MISLYTALARPAFSRPGAPDDLFVGGGQSGVWQGVGRRSGRTARGSQRGSQDAGCSPRGPNRPLDVRRVKSVSQSVRLYFDKQAQCRQETLIFAAFGKRKKKEQKAKRVKHKSTGQEVHAESRRKVRAYRTRTSSRQNSCGASIRRGIVAEGEISFRRHSLEVSSRRAAGQVRVIIHSGNNFLRLSKAGCGEQSASRCSRPKADSTSLTVSCWWRRQQIEREVCNVCLG